jgi:hypothetical protein
MPFGQEPDFICKTPLVVGAPGLAAQRMISSAWKRRDGGIVRPRAWVRFFLTSLRIFGNFPDTPGQALEYDGIVDHVRQLLLTDSVRAQSEAGGTRDMERRARSGGWCHGEGHMRGSCCLRLGMRGKQGHYWAMHDVLF